MSKTVKMDRLGKVGKIVVEVTGVIGPKPWLPVIRAAGNRKVLFTTPLPYGSFRRAVGVCVNLIRSIQAECPIIVKRDGKTVEEIA